MTETTDDKTEDEIKHCVACDEAFWIGRHDDWGDVLDHWAAEHNDSEVFWRVIKDARTWTRCGSCGEMFVSDLSADNRGLTVSLYCDECLENGLKTKVKSLVVEDVSGRYVLDNETSDEESGCA